MLFYNIKQVNHFGKEVDEEKRIATLKLNDIIFYSYRVIQNINVKELSDPFPKEKKRINIIAPMFSLALATKSAVYKCRARCKFAFNKQLSYRVQC